MADDGGESPVSVTTTNNTLTSGDSKHSESMSDVCSVDMNNTADGGKGPRLTIFQRLPAEIIHQILLATDPDTFASLILISPQWHRVSQDARLYAHQLLQCPSYTASHPSALAGLREETHYLVQQASRDDSGHDDNHDNEEEEEEEETRKKKCRELSRLRRLFAQEVQRNLFAAYLRPHRTHIKLVSNSISSSSAPGGEGMQFSASPKGHHLLAYNSSRIYVLDVRGAKVEVSRELKILRRPVSTCILDDASLLAVLSSDMQVDIYDVSKSPPKRTRCLILDHTPRTIALSPCGRVLAAAYEGGIEVSSLNPGALSTERRAVKCDGVDALAFSCDGTQLLGTSTGCQTSNTVILTAPYYDAASQMNDNNLSALWTTSILFPNTSRDCSHAVLLPDPGLQEASFTLTYDRSYETFRAVRIDDLRNGTTYFTGPIPNTTTQPTLLPCTLPAATGTGQLVSAGFQGKDIWLYGIPEDLEAIPSTNAAHQPDSSPASGLNRRDSARSLPLTGRHAPWQNLCDKNRNTFVSGRKVAELDGVSMMKWVAGFGESCLQERLILAAKGIQRPKLITEEDGIDFVDGGRITVLDFDYSPRDGGETFLEVEVGTRQPEILEEEQRDMDTEVAIVRRRTVAQQRGNRRIAAKPPTASAAQVDSLLRTPAPHGSSLHNDNNDNDDGDPLVPRRIVHPSRRTPLPTRSTLDVSSLEESDEPTLEEIQEALDAPYAHATPRTAPTLRRAATAAAVNRRLNAAAPTSGRVQYRRADGRAEHPHESDADRWIPPPPPYSEEDPGATPNFLRQASIPGAGINQSNAAAPSPGQTVPVPAIPAIPAAFLNNRHDSSNAAPRRPNLQLQTSVTESDRRRSRYGMQQFNASEGNLGGNLIRSAINPTTTTGRDEPEEPGENIYDVSPIDSAPASAPSNMSPGLPRRSNTLASSTTASEHGPTSPLSQHGSPETSRARPVLNLATDSPALQHTVPHHALDVTSPPRPSVWSSPSAAPVRSWPRTAPADEGAATFASTDRIAYATPAPAPHSAATPGWPPSRVPCAREMNRPSSVYMVPRGPPVGSTQDRRSVHMQAPPVSPEPEAPLIISTPSGIMGSAPDPAHRLSVLHQPVPRHPRPAVLGPTAQPPPPPMGGASSRTVPYPFLNQQPNTQPTSPHTHSHSRLAASQLTASSLRYHTSLTRRQSRARRSAAKNVHDAKKSVWMGRRRVSSTKRTKSSSKKKKNQKQQQQMPMGMAGAGGRDFDAASSAAWTDVTWASALVAEQTGGQQQAQTGQGAAGRRRKCVVM